MALDILVAIGVNGMYELKFNGTIYPYCPSEEVIPKDSWRGIAGQVIVWGF